jgi:predicted SprT family Zn-dependent metalloprotease
MRIPARFKLHAQQIEVAYDSNVDFRNDNRGEAQYRINRIALAPSSSSHPRPQTQIEQTFCHELIHYISHHAGVELSERDTDIMGNLLHQALTTMEYE